MSRAVPAGAPVEVAFQFGSNVGDKRGHVARAARLVEAAGLASDLRVSGLYRTPPWGGVPQDWFVNACAVGLTTLPAFDLLRRVKAAEVALGRVETVRWGPRVIDIDILYRGEDAIDTPDLTLPHRDVLNRGFVLVPLAEFVPGRVIRGITVAEAAARADVEGIVPLGDEA